MIYHSPHTRRSISKSTVYLLSFHVEDQSEVRELNKFWEKFPDIDFKVVKFNGRKRKRTCILRISREGLMDLDRKTEQTIHCQDWKEIDTVFIQ